MGSGQSAPTPPTTSKEPPTASSGEKPPRQTTTQRSKRQPPPHLSGAKLVEYKCRKKKRAWANCVGSWYDTRFLSGKALEEEQADCDEMFDRFRECYMRNMLKEREKQGLPPPKGDTMLAEFIEEEGSEN